MTSTVARDAQGVAHAPNKLFGTHPAELVTSCGVRGLWGHLVSYAVRQSPLIMTMLPGEVDCMSCLVAEAPVMTPPLREHATDRFGIVHEVFDGAWSIIETRCGIRAGWQDRVVLKRFKNDIMTWDGFDPKPDVTCMACLVREARR